jgi:hypothetical protein
MRRCIALRRLRSAPPHSMPNPDLPLSTKSSAGFPVESTERQLFRTSDASPAENRARPGEVLVRGRRTRSGQGAVIQLHRGEGVLEDDVAFFRRSLVDARPSILTFFPPYPLPEPGLLPELAERGYDLGTFSLSIHLRTAHFAHPKRLRMVPSLQGKLLARWGRIEYDCPDLCTSWGLPARRCDSHLLLGFFSSAPYSEGDRHNGYSPRRHLTFLEELKARHYDVRTLRLTVTRTQDDLPKTGQGNPDRTAATAPSGFPTRGRPH